MFEAILMVVIAAILISLSRLEKDLFQLSEKLSEHREFFQSVVYFGLININVVLILVLSFLIFRNVVKLVVERRRGVIGSRLRSKLVISLVFFATAPTALLFYVSTRFLTDSFDTWFSSRVETTISSTKDVSALVYQREERRLESLARIALPRVRVRHFPHLFGPLPPVLEASQLEGFDSEYRLFAVRVYDHFGRLVWSSGQSKDANIKLAEDFVETSWARFLANPGMTSRGSIKVEQGKDVVRGAAPIYDKTHGLLVGIVLTEEQFETQIIGRVEAILKEFSSLKPRAQITRLTHNILLVVMVLIIVFSATWMGFYVAKGIIRPIQSLAEATKKVALGNYEVSLEAIGDDETALLIRSFNQMTSDLKTNQSQVLEFTKKLEETNIELESRRKYMEVVLQHITAGVISLGVDGRITAVNDAAAKLLHLDPLRVVGLPMGDALTDKLREDFWQPIEEHLQHHQVFSSQVEISQKEGQLNLIIDATRLADESHVDLGVVLVFADASEQVKAQRVAAWREVARRIAHEIKNPITPIKLSAQRLLRRFGHQFSGEDREVFGRCVETIVHEVDNLRDLVNEFSKFSRLPTIKPSPMQLNDVIREVQGLYAMSYPHIDIDLSQLGADLPPIMIDKEQMSRVFGNLFKNAERALREVAHQPRITIKTSVMPALSVVRLEIADNGPGIPDRIKSRIFEPYFSTKEEGTGLGLAIVSQIVTDHGGYLRVVDERPSGARFIIDLPLMRPLGLKV